MVATKSVSENIQENTPFHIMMSIPIRRRRVRSLTRLKMANRDRLILSLALAICWTWCSIFFISDSILLLWIISFRDMSMRTMFRESSHFSWVLSRRYFWVWESIHTTMMCIMISPKTNANAYIVPIPEKRYIRNHPVMVIFVSSLIRNESWSIHTFDPSFITDISLQVPMDSR